MTTANPELQHSISGRARRPTAQPISPLAILLAVIFILLVVPPLIFLVQGGLYTTNPDGSAGAFTFDYYVKLFSSTRLADRIVNSVTFAIGSAVIAIVFGGLLAWIVERTNTPFKTLAYLTTIISLGTPYVLYVGAWLFLLGRSGPINDLYRTISGSSLPLFNVYSMTGMILVEGFLWSPMAFLLLSAAFRNANPELEEAARMSGASVWDTINRITLRLSMPALAALAFLVLIRAIEAFEVPALVGLPGRVQVLTTDIYLDIKGRVPPDLGDASAFSTVLLVMVAVLLYFYTRFSRHAERYQTVTGKGFRPRLFDLGRGRVVTAAILILNFLLILVLPNLALIWASLLPFYQSFSIKALNLLTIENYRAVFNSSSYLDLVWNTLLIAAVSATTVVLLTLMAAWLAVRRRPGGWLLDQLATMPLIFPGIVLGVAVMQIFLSVPIPIYGTIWIIVIAFVISYLPYGMRYSYSGMLQIHKELEEAAGVAGATPLTSFRRVVAPLIAPSLVAGWLFVFLLAARALSLPILLSGPSSQTVAVAMYDLWVNGQATELAALGVVWTALMTVISFIFYSLADRNVGRRP